MPKHQSPVVVTVGFDFLSERGQVVSEWPDAGKWTRTVDAVAAMHRAAAAQPAGVTLMVVLDYGLDTERPYAMTGGTR